MIEYALILPGAYLLGSISWGLIMGKLKQGVDIRRHGSGSTGTTNVLRILGIRMAAIVLVADISKGIIAVLVAKFASNNLLLEALAALSVVAGHNWPVFSRFRGGRGITAAVGSLAMLAPIVAALALAAFVPVVSFSRYVSLASISAVIVAVAAMPVMVALDLAPWQYLVYTTAGGPLIIWRHRGNIQRLINGTENRLQFGGGPPGAVPPHAR